VTNKEKILATAQKYLQKNNLPRAIKEYVKVLEIDSKDVRSRQKLAELYGRTANVEEALSHYAIVATYYAENTFYLKAIAVYKQMQKLAPTDLKYTMKLAKLNEQQGLVGNALAEYRLLFDSYEKSGQHENAVDVLNSMRALDPNNLTVAMRVVSYYADLGDSKKAQDEYAALEAKLITADNYKQLQLFYKHFIALWPDDVDVQIGYGRAMIGGGELIGGVQYLTSLQRQYPKNPDVLFALACGFHACAEYKHELECLLRLVKFVPESLDYQHALYRAALDAEDPDLAFSVVEKGRHLFEAAGNVVELKPYYERLRELLPDNRDVLAALNKIYELLGEGEKLFDVLSTGLDDKNDDYAPSVADNAGSLGAFNDQFEEMQFDNAASAEESKDEDISFDDITFDLEDDNETGTSADFDLEQNDMRKSPVVDIQADLEEAAFYLQQGLLDEAQKVCQRLESVSPTDAKVLALQQQIAQRRPNSTGADTSAVRSNSDVEIDFSTDSSEVVLDLDLSELETDVINPDLVDSFDLADNDSDIDAGIAELNFAADGQSDHTLADSQRGVVTVINEEDTESAYNLGIAYKEMGLLDDAITEFDKATASSARIIDCACLKAACYIAQQKFTAAEDVLTEALSGSLSLEQKILLYYETGLLYEAWDRGADALASYQIVAASDPSFRDVSSKIVELKEAVNSGNGSTSDSSRVSYL